MPYVTKSDLKALVRKVLHHASIGAFAVAIVCLADVQARAEGFFGGAFKDKSLKTYATFVAARPGVTTTCFPKELKVVLTKIKKHFGQHKVLVSSGYRSKRHNRRVRGARKSYHIKCMAADIQIKGVGKYKLARYARKLDGVGGVGTYTCNGSVHVDVGPKRSWHWRCGRRRK